jgi:hypothetical protein
MIAVRYATLVALVFWLGVMTGARFSGIGRRLDLVSYACGGAMFVGLVAMKFLGPPPRAFFVRAGLALAMLAIAAAASLTALASAEMLLTLNIVLGLTLLTWYARE